MNEWFRQHRESIVFRLVLAGLMIVTLVSACIAEPAGTVVWGVNQSDSDVIVASSHHSNALGPLVLPAHTWGKLYDDHGKPTGALTLFDSKCGLLATLLLTRAMATVWIKPDGTVHFAVGDPGVVPTGVGRAPDDLEGGRRGWEVADCGHD